MTSILKSTSSLACKTFVIYEFWLRVQHLCILPTQLLCIFLLVLTILKSFHYTAFTVALCNTDGKAIPLQAWIVPEGSRSLRIPDFKKIGT